MNVVSDKRKNGIPKSVVARYTEYLNVLRSLREKGDDWVSSRTLAERLNYTSSTVRQDLSHLSFSGISKRGYEIAGLEKEISGVLGLNIVRNVVVIGAGNLGRALAQHLDSLETGFNICGIFDNDVRKIGMKVGSLEILGDSSFPSFARENDVTVGILAVPDSAAQDAADMLVSAGITGILNFTSKHLVLASDQVACTDVRIVASLQELSHGIIAKMQGE